MPGSGIPPNNPHVLFALGAIFKTCFMKENQMGTDRRHHQTVIAAVRKEGFRHHRALRCSIRQADTMARWTRNVSRTEAGAPDILG
jgi:hypothetical protein